MILLLTTIVPQIAQEDNSVKLSLIVIMPQIIYKRVYFLLFSYHSLASWISRIMFSRKKTVHIKDLFKILVECHL